MAVAGNVNLPTGNENAFTSDGVLTGGVTLITDYRFNFGLILATNLGLWLRPDTQFAGVRIGNMAQLGVAGEMYVVQRWGLSVIGEVYGYPSLTSFPDSPKQVPAEALLGLRWQTKQGITITFGGSFGAACGFGSPAIRFFNGITFQPKSSREQEEINRLLMGDSYDLDHDGITGDADKCPDKPGSPERFGCHLRPRRRMPVRQRRRARQKRLPPGLYQGQGDRRPRTGSFRAGQGYHPRRVEADPRRNRARTQG
jgi:hypothetical protein